MGPAKTEYSAENDKHFEGADDQARSLVFGLGNCSDRLCDLIQR